MPNPEFLLADEAVSALDVSLQARIVNLLAEMRRRFSLTMLFITHDLSLVEYLCDRVAVMYAGTIVETAPADELCRSPMHPYTQALLSAIPRIDPRRKTARLIMKEEGDSAGEAAEGCVFAGRCQRARKGVLCGDSADAPRGRLFGSPGSLPLRDAGDSSAAKRLRMPEKVPPIPCTIGV